MKAANHTLSREEYRRMWNLSRLQTISKIKERWKKIEKLLQWLRRKSRNCSSSGVKNCLLTCNIPQQWAAKVQSCISTKPKKARLKQHQHQHQASSSMASSSTPPGTAAAAPPPPPPPPPPHQPPKESFIRRNKFIWPLLLAVNFTVGAYLFTRTNKKDGVEKGEVPNVPPASVSTTATTATITQKSLAPSPILEPPKSREPIPENDQRKLYKWMLEEKRKLKPKDPEEKKRIDEEKAILKRFILAKFIPSL